METDFACFAKRCRLNTQRVNDVPEQLRVIAEKVSKGERQKETVRVLLSWFGQHRRGLHVVNNVRSALEELHIKTEPDFELAFFDGPVDFLSISGQNQKQVAGLTSSRINKGASGHTDEESKLSTDPVMRVEILEAANRKNLCTVTRDAPLEEATTLMSTRHFSQLPVLQGFRGDMKVEMVSWKSIGEQMAWGRECKFVRDCTEHAEIIPWNTPLITAVSKIVEHEVVLVRGQENTITGLVTTTDLALEFRKLSEPFLLLGEIENHVRRIILGKFLIQDLAEAKNPNDNFRNVGSISDLTMGEYIRFLENPENWKRLACKLDRKTFIERLEAVRRIRNDVMHFHPDPVEQEDIDLLQEIARFFRGF
ncbi:MAG: CBS domain-containing protein [Verrucomicrobiia bacterium]